jgi:DNA-3-methyladenine glycosylase II
MDNTSVILIPIPALFCFQECVWFLNRNYDDCLHVIEGDVIFKAIDIEGQAVLFCVRENISFLEVNILAGEASLEVKEYLNAYIREWFDMERDVQPFYDLLVREGRLAYMVDEFRGLRLIGISNLFEAVCWCIIGQQINLSFAYKVKRRLVERYGRHIDHQGKTF